MRQYLILNFLNVHINFFNFCFAFLKYVRVNKTKCIMTPENVLKKMFLFKTLYHQCTNHTKMDPGLSHEDLQLQSHFTYLR